MSRELVIQNLKKLHDNEEIVESALKSIKYFFYKTKIDISNHFFLFLYLNQKDAQNPLLRACQNNKQNSTL